MEKQDFDILVPGHGKLGDRHSIKEFYGQLSGLINRMKEQIDEGCSREAITVRGV